MTFDLAQPDVAARRALHLKSQFVVTEPVAVQPLDSDRVLVRRSDATLATLAHAQWSDRLPRLVQARIVQAFENAGAVGRVGIAGGPITPDVTLYVEIRAFEVDAGAGRGKIELAVKLVDAVTGRTRAARVFQADAPGATEGPDAVKTLDQALGQVLAEIVRWAGPRI
ncbi:MAG: membrane integrity-associated transporter subunit PqiC [Hyphomicrobiales bacterium]|nr:membrane integrity-associated transporter subunit PqiC [Hyphomicrobiales bacterium]MBV9590998.1 membrane integrity-associated transporter subunit PqiC [Hyphomicrobiales bacterium]MBV9753869.1 membrane integrity-associated transporter subunit PqiC [Hyphomicrobiales bacterium]MBV9974835.1 membrane integrity-associated transporter subunit PqiC [Hyphomicrobiales bacterium]